MALEVSLCLAALGLGVGLGQPPLSLWPFLCLVSVDSGGGGVGGSGGMHRGYL